MTRDLDKSSRRVQHAASLSGFPFLIVHSQKVVLWTNAMSCLTKRLQLDSLGEPAHAWMRKESLSCQPGERNVGVQPPPREIITRGCGPDPIRPGIRWRDMMVSPFLFDQHTNTAQRNTASTSKPHRHCREERRRESRPRPRPRQAAFAPYPGVVRVDRAHPPGRHMYSEERSDRRRGWMFDSAGQMTGINHEVTFLRI